jgi:hypothetical protein
MKANLKNKSYRKNLFTDHSLLITASITMAIKMTLIWKCLKDYNPFFPSAQ